MRAGVVSKSTVSDMAFDEFEVWETGSYMPMNNSKGKRDQRETPLLLFSPELAWFWEMNIKRVGRR